MIIHSKFGIGDKVFAVYIKHVTNSFPCPDCKGFGRLKNKDEQVINCRRCGGDGELTATDFSFIVQKATVQAVTVSVYKKEQHEKYIVETDQETRVCDNVFATQAEAEKVCKILNGGQSCPQSN